MMLKTLFGKKTDERFPEEEFVIAQAERQGLPVIATINRGYRRYAHKAEYPWHAEIVVSMEHTTDTGLPTNDEAEVLNTLEDQLESALKAQGAAHHIARQTWNNIRMLDYYVDDGAAAEKALAALAAASARPLQFKVEKDETWSSCAGFF
jgi:hypothetical protein